MKRSMSNFVLVTLFVSILSASLITWLESLYGITNIFLGATCCVFATGMLLSVKQLINHLKP